MHACYKVPLRSFSLSAFRLLWKAIPIVMQLMLNFPQRILAKELAALAVNLSLNARNAQMMASQKGLHHLMERVVETKDALLMKASGGRKSSYPDHYIGVLTCTGVRADGRLW